ncbi:MAG: DUF4345 family protein [Sphingopyxis sp.]
MIFDDMLRQALLALTALTFVGFALWALFSPANLAQQLGYTINDANGHSEFRAIYIGLFIAQAALAITAAYRVHDALWGDMVALFLLAQPAGRLVALPRYGMPYGLLRLLFGLEIVSGLALLGVRPG